MQEMDLQIGLQGKLQRRPPPPPKALQARNIHIKKCWPAQQLLAKDISDVICCSLMDVLRVCNALLA